MNLELYQIQIFKTIGKDPQADILSNWPHKNACSNTEEFNLIVNLFGKE